MATTPPAPERARFDRLARLYGEAAVERLGAARVVIFGLGGVGSFAAEALARSAVGHLLLVDFDEVALSNTNRQLQALSTTVAQPKALLLRDRLRLINPGARIECRQARYSADTSDELLQPVWPGPTPAYDFVVDCIDNLRGKAHLLLTCRERGIPVVSAMGAAGKVDPTRVRVADLGDTDVCPMAQQLRKALRQKHGLPKGRGRLGITAVFSAEPRRWPRAVGDTTAATAGEAEPDGLGRAMVEGSAVFVTAAFGLACAAHVVNTLVGDLAEQAPPAPVPPKRASRAGAGGNVASG
jgi:tRNA A37 threonylcarbamoyladenosine dehydratase